MTRDTVFDIVKSNITAVLPEVGNDQIQGHMQLRDLGADSIDRADISTSAMEELNLELPLVELGKPNTIGELVDLLYEHASK
ncbi:acyl carrier protein [Pseudenhygromyxa sp. WMMC2535]|uniref:acyl carrier protein n=1 Tax=Pseudenhygromyxa sp. WMMC2535 TaxID=2712867 RepID=UPI001554E419|nr:acyl carrier protein [Pseudenhygromyxa sp. WMMC2535]NVB40709.1 acyl carrier protein [Pseudenhygromyxa sp. WMMC2535]